MPQQDRWWCPMCGAMDGAWGWGMMFAMSLFWIAVIVLVAWLIMRVARGSGESGEGRGGRGGRAEEILRERFAKGEIDRETYERMLEELRRGER